MDKTHVTINVAGQELRLSADDSEAYIRKIAGYVNDKVDEVQRSYPNLSTANCLIMAALNLSDELHKLREDYDALDSRISELREIRGSGLILGRFFKGWFIYDGASFPGGQPGGIDCRRAERGGRGILWRQHVQCQEVRGEF